MEKESKQAYEAPKAQVEKLEAVHNAHSWNPGKGKEGGGKGWGKGEGGGKGHKSR